MIAEVILRRSATHPAQVLAGTNVAYQTRALAMEMERKMTRHSDAGQNEANPNQESNLM